MNPLVAPMYYFSYTSCSLLHLNFLTNWSIILDCRSDLSTADVQHIKPNANQEYFHFTPECFNLFVANRMHCQKSVINEKWGKLFTSLACNLVVDILYVHCVGRFSSHEAHSVQDHDVLILKKHHKISQFSLWSENVTSRPIAMIKSFILRLFVFTLTSIFLLKKFEKNFLA